MGRKHITVPFEIKEDDIKDDGTFSGYGSTFGGKPDSYGDIIVAGAFTQTLSEGGRNGFGVAMLYQHDASRPVGVWDHLAEDSKGLKIQGRLALKTELGRDTHELMKIGALRGLSIGYDHYDHKEDVDYNKEEDAFYLKRIRLWEVSPVTFAANISAQITTVKMIREAKTTRELEDTLRESGLSREAAKYIVSLCKDSLRESEAGVDWDQILSIVKEANKI